MNERGVVDWLVKAVVAVAILVILLLIAFPAFGDQIVNIENIATGFKDVRDVDSSYSIVGINLDDLSELRYFTGDKRVEIRNLDESFRLNQHVFVPLEVRTNLRSFYFDTSRKPEKLRFWIDHFRYLELNDRSIGGYVFDEIVPDPFFRGPFGNGRLVVSYDDNSIVMTKEISDFDSSDFREKFISWRDQILSGGEFEKYVSLNVNNESKNFRVVRVDNYVYVDLDRPVEGADKYSTEEFEDDFVEVPERMLNNVSVEITFTEVTGIWPFRSFTDKSVSWKSRAWEFGDKDLRSVKAYIVEDSERKIFFEAEYVESDEEHDLFYRKVVSEYNKYFVPQYYNVKYLSGVGEYELGCDGGCTLFFADNEINENSLEVYFLGNTIFVRQDSDLIKIGEYDLNNGFISIDLAKFDEEFSYGSSLRYHLMKIDGKNYYDLERGNVIY